MTIGADLVRQMAAGDREAFAVFYDRYAPVVFPLILRIVRERADASDVLQEVFWEAWRDAPGFDSTRGSPEAWMVTRAATYAVGALDGQDRVEFERHLAGGCDICEATLRESAETLAALARARPPMIPPPAVREELLRRIGTAPARRGASRPRPLVWAVGTIVA